MLQCCWSRRHVVSHVNQCFCWPTGRIKNMVETAWGKAHHMLRLLLQQFLKLNSLETAVEWFRKDWWVKTVKSDGDGCVQLVAVGKPPLHWYDELSECSVPDVGTVINVVMLLSLWWSVVVSVFSYTVVLAHTTWETFCCGFCRTEKSCEEHVQRLWVHVGTHVCDTSTHAET